jgi:hypothetical protein
MPCFFLFFRLYCQEKQVVSFFRIFFLLTFSSLRQYLFFVRRIFQQEKSLKHQKSRRELARLKIYATFPTVMFEPSHRFFFQQEMKKELRWACTYVSIITPLFDDYFERDEIEKLKSIIQHKDEANAHKEVLIQRCYDALKWHVADAEQLSRDIDEVFEQQLKADEQKSKTTLPLEDIESITREKSAIGFYLIMHLTQQEIKDSMRKIIDQLAFLLQLGDDIFDLWFDLQDGSQTLATNCEDAHSLKIFYWLECEKLVQYVYAFNSDKKKANAFLEAYFFIIARVFVALNQYIHIDFNALRADAAHHRKQLVCDMEKLNNNWKWINCYKELKLLLSES